MGALTPLWGQIPVAAASTTWYVANGGSGTCASTSSANPLPSISAAVGCAASGDTISVAPGTYAGSVTIDRNVTLTGAGASSTVLENGGPDVTVTSGTTASISGVTITQSNFQGYGLHNDGTLTVSDSVITHNAQSWGAGIANTTHATLTLVRTTVSHNAAISGGGINNTGLVTVIDSTVSDNQASESGGGIFNNTPGGGGITLVNSTVSGNTAGYGGGFYNICNGVASITNSTISDNVAMHYAGGIYSESGFACPNSRLLMSNALLAGNRLVGNDPQGFGPDCYGILIDGAGHNIIGDNNRVGVGCGLSNGVNGDQVGGAGNPVIDPKLAPVGSYGGTTETMGLLPGSPAIGAGDATTCASTGSAGVNNVDQRGASRGTPGRGVCDVGAYDTFSDARPPAVRAPRTWYVSPSGSDTESCASNSSVAPFGGVPYALSCAQDGDTIMIGAGTYDFSSTGGLAIEKSVSLAGAGAASTTFEGGNGVVNVVQTYSVNLSGVTVTHTHQTGSGSGVSNDGVLSLTDSIVTNSFGASISNSWIMTLMDSLVTGNVGDINNSESLTLMRSTVSNNIAGAIGGGIHSDGGAAYSVLSLVNSTVSGNRITGTDPNFAHGGGIWTGCDAMTATNSTISNNYSAGTGGGIYFHDSCGPVNSIFVAHEVVLSNTILAGNSVAAGSSGPDCYASQANGSNLTDGTGHNILGNNSSCDGLTNGTNGDQVGSPGSPVNPMLGPLGNYGGPTPTMGLLAGSPAIGNADPATCTAPPVGGIDQRSVNRGTGTCDIGAYDTSSDGYHLQTVSVAPNAGWNLVGGFPLTLWSDALASWSWNALSGQWAQPSGFDPSGLGAWEELGAAPGPHTVYVRSCASGVTLTVMPHRWNMVGNPCDKDVSLPTGVRALFWNGSTYTVSAVISKGMAAWVLPASGQLTLTPTG